MRQAIIRMDTGEVLSDRHNGQYNETSPDGLHTPGQKNGPIIGRSEVMNTLFESIRRVASVPSTALISGESGTGKELVARAIHGLSGRKSGPFVPVHCGAIPESLLESELFGFRKGAFTGADRNRTGLFVEANNGTLFLDEISSMSRSIQPKLLRVIEEKKVTPLGENHPDALDIPLVCATNRNLRQLVEQGQFREDLFFRLNVIELRIPPLRERREDIPDLARYFIAEFNRLLKRSIQGITPDALSLLVNHPWPGNVRELQNMMERAVLFAEGEIIDHALLQPLISDGCGHGEIMPDNLSLAMKIFEKKHIHRVLMASEGNKKEAAARLGIGLSSFYRKWSG